MIVPLVNWIVDSNVLATIYLLRIITHIPISNVFLPKSIIYCGIAIHSSTIATQHGFVPYCFTPGVLLAT